MKASINLVENDLAMESLWFILATVQWETLARFNLVIWRIGYRSPKLKLADLT